MYHTHGRVDKSEEWHVSAEEKKLKQDIRFQRSVLQSQSGSDRKQTQKYLDYLQRKLRRLRSGKKFYESYTRGRTMKVKIKKTVLKEAVKKLLKQQSSIQEGFVGDLKKKFRGNLQGFKAWVQSNWASLDPSYKDALKSYMGVREVKGRQGQQNPQGWQILKKYGFSDSFIQQLISAVRSHPAQRIIQILSQASRTRGFMTGPQQ